MKLSSLSSTSAAQLLLLVMTWGSGVRGQPCPPGQISHSYDGQIKCCLPTDCDPNHFLKYCEKNGTEDTCEHCPANYGLYKRTSSFAYEPCHNLLLDPLEPQKCKAAEGSSDRASEDVKNCHCDLEKGEYYYPPQIDAGPTSSCQLIKDECNPGYQPRQSGKCEPCPPNTVQSETDFKLCRPQRNCTRLSLETKFPGNSMKEAVCASLPPLPPVSTASQIMPSSTPTPSLPQSTTSVSPNASVRTSVSNDNDAPLIVVIAVVCSVLVIGLVLLICLGHRKGWFICIWKGKCQHQDVERHAGVGNQMQLSSQDNDNTSDNSCYTCSDSCLTSSNKNSSTPGKAGAGACEPSKAPRPLPMLEAYMNMNGKGPQSLPSDGSWSEPLYNSISQDERLQMKADSMPSYKNTNGFIPSSPWQETLHQPNRVHLTVAEEDDSMKNPCYAQVQQRAAALKNARDREDFTETDPLLPPSENCSSGVPTPVSTPALRGILRNGNNRQDPKRKRDGTEDAVTGTGDGSVGNRPHLSMLLNTTEDTSHLVAEESQPANVPHLSQLMSARCASQGPGPQPAPPPQHQQLLQEQAPQVQHQSPELLPQRGQQGSPLAARLIPVSSAVQQPQLNPSLVQMEELKPVLPLSPGANPSSPAGGTGAGPQNKECSGSPARISPTQQEIRAGSSPKMFVRRPVLTDDALAATSPAAADNVKKDVNGKATAEQEKTTAEVEGDEGATKAKEIEEETFRKQAVPGAAPGSEETLQKSVCASSGLGDSLDFSSPLDLPSEDDGRSRTMYRRSNSEASRSVSPIHQLPPSRSNSTPEEKHRPFAVVKPMQSDQSLNTMSDSHDRLTELTQQLDAAGRQFPLTSLAGRSPARQTSQTAPDDSDQTRPKTPDTLSEEEEEGEGLADGRQGGSEERTRDTFIGENDEGGERQDKGSDGSCES